MSTVRLTIDVTQDDIAIGFKQNCQACPVARACFRILGVDVSVNGDQVKDYEWPHVLESDLPPEVGRWIGRFDAGWEVEPFSFDIDVPAEALALAR
jgi:hypothetical protein